MRQRTLLTCLALAGLGHAALLWAVSNQARPELRMPGAPPTAALQVRQIRAWEQSAYSSEVAPQVEAAAPVLLQQHRAREADADASGGAPERSNLFAAEPPTPTTEASRSNEAPPPDDGRFWPRNWLDQPPTPRSVIDLPYPADAPIGRFRAVYTLFIGADGRVLHMRVEGPELPRALDEAARQAFLGGQFEPGRKDGRAVRSHMQIELNYDASQPLSAPLVAPPEGAASGAEGAAGPSGIDAAR